MSNLGEMNLDLSGASAGLEAGDYRVICTNSEVKDTNSGTGKYIKIELTVNEGPASGMKIFHNFNIQNPNEQAQRIGLGQLKSFLKAGGHANPDLLKDVWELVNLECIAKVKIEQSEYGEQPRISYFKPLAVAAPVAAPQAAGKVF